MSHISIRPWNDFDVEVLSILFNNKNIWNNLRDYVPHPYTVDHAREFISEQIKTVPTQNFAILEGKDVVGGIGIIFKSDIYRMNVELGYWIGEPFWGRKIATEAVRLVTEYIFENFAVNRINAEVFEYNKPSMRVLEKNGYYLETVARKGILKNDLLFDNYIWVKQKLY